MAVGEPGGGHRFDLAVVVPAVGEGRQAVGGGADPVDPDPRKLVDLGPVVERVHHLVGPGRRRPRLDDVVLVVPERCLVFQPVGDRHQPARVIEAAPDRCRPPRVLDLCQAAVAVPAVPDDGAGAVLMGHEAVSQVVGPRRGPRPVGHPASQPVLVVPVGEGGDRHVVGRVVGVGDRPELVGLVVGHRRTARHRPCAATARVRLRRLVAAGVIAVRSDPGQRVGHRHQTVLGVVGVAAGLARPVLLGLDGTARPVGGPQRRRHAVDRWPHLLGRAADRVIDHRRRVALGVDRPLKVAVGIEGPGAEPAQTVGDPGDQPVRIGPIVGLVAPAVP